jgi:hypothetical protein
MCGFRGFAKQHNGGGGREKDLKYLNFLVAKILN